MKKIFACLSLLLLPVLLLTDCTVYYGRGFGGGMVGTDAEGLDATADRFHADRINNSTAFGKAADTIKAMWNAYIMKEGLTFLAGKYYGHQGKIVDAGTTVELEKLHNAKSVADAKAQLDLLNAANAAAH